MIPTTVGAVAVFLLLIAPGLAFELLSQRARPARVDSAFIEISRVLLAGTVITSVVVLLLGIIRIVNPDAVVDVGALIRSGNAYWAGHLPLIAWSAAAHLTLALLVAFLAHDVFRGRRASVIVTDSAWHILFQKVAPEGTKPFLSVQLKNGTTYTGYRAEYSTEQEPAKREVVLSPPIEVRPPGEPQAAALSQTWQRMWIRGDEIATLAVSYVGTPTGGPSKPKAKPGYSSPRWAAVLGVVLVLVSLLVGG